MQNNWTNDELLISLKLYQEVKKNKIKDNKTNDTFIKFFELFNLVQKNESIRLRTKDSLYMRLQNWKSLDPTYKGKGLNSATKSEKLKDIFNKYFDTEVLDQEFDKIKEKHSEQKVFSLSRKNLIAKFKSHLKKFDRTITIHNHSETPFLMTYKNKYYYVHLTNITAWKGRPDMRRIIIGKNTRDKFLAELDEDTILVVLGYDVDLDIYASWQIPNVLTNFKKTKSLYTKELFLNLASNNGIALDTSSYDNDSRTIAKPFPLIFKSEYLSEFLKYPIIRSFNEQTLNCYDHLIDENKNKKFLNEILKIESQDFTPTTGLQKLNITFKKFEQSNINPSNKDDLKLIDLIEKNNLLDRASSLHQETLNLIDTLLKNKNIECYEDRKSFDLFFKNERLGFLLEIKSLGNDNFISQTRSGFIQLQEYSFMQNENLCNYFNIDEIKKILVYHENPSNYSDSKIIENFTEFAENLRLNLLYVEKKCLKFLGKSQPKYLDILVK